MVLGYASNETEEYMPFAMAAASCNEITLFQDKILSVRIYWLGTEACAADRTAEWSILWMIRKSKIF